MNYATIKKTDIANGTGVRVSLFVSGCTHHCKGCFNPETWDFDYGQPFTREVAREILDACAPDYISGLSLLGGEPFERANQAELLKLLEEFGERYPQKNVWCYTGYTFEKLLRNPRQAQLLKYIDVLVDGKFKKELRDEELYFRGSRNQRLIDVQTSLQKGETVIYHYNPKKGI